MKKLIKRILPFALVVAMCLCMAAPAFAYEAEPGDEKTLASPVNAQARITQTAGVGYMHTNGILNKAWGESYGYQWGEITYMYVSCRVTANDGTNTSRSAENNYDGSEGERSLTTAKITCTETSGRHMATSHIITGNWNGTERYAGEKDW